MASSVPLNLPITTFPAALTQLPAAMSTTTTASHTKADSTDHEITITTTPCASLAAALPSPPSYYSLPPSPASEICPTDPAPLYALPRSSFFATHVAGFAITMAGMLVPIIYIIDHIIGRTNVLHAWLWMLPLCWVVQAAEMGLGWCGYGWYQDFYSTAEDTCGRRDMVASGAGKWVDKKMDLEKGGYRYSVVDDREEMAGLPDGNTLLVATVVAVLVFGSIRFLGLLCGWGLAVAVVFVKHPEVSWDVLVGRGRWF